MKKKLMALVLTACMVASLTACGSGGGRISSRGAGSRTGCSRGRCACK